MIKLLMFLLVLTASVAHARDFVLVGVSGYGTGENGKGQPSGAHNNLPSHKRLIATHKLTHFVKTKELEELVESLHCKEPNAPGLVIMANSWGSTQAHKLSEIYERECGEQVQLFVMVDGVKKPIGPFKKTPVARECINYYQVKSTIKGGEIEGCENIDLSEYCKKGKIAACHIDVEWIGTHLGARNILNNI